MFTFILASLWMITPNGKLVAFRSPERAAYQEAWGITPEQDFAEVMGVDPDNNIVLNHI
jgi:hypothetical protein